MVKGDGREAANLAILIPTDGGRIDVAPAKRVVVDRVVVQFVDLHPGRRGLASAAGGTAIVADAVSAAVRTPARPRRIANRSGRDGAERPPAWWSE